MPLSLEGLTARFRQKLLAVLRRREKKLLRAERATESLIGRPFGLLIVQALVRTAPNFGRVWLCRCSGCGRDVERSTNGLHTIAKKGHQGCRECASALAGKASSSESLVGRRFGNLVVDAPAASIARLGGRAWACHCVACRSEVVKITSELHQIARAGRAGCKTCAGQRAVADGWEQKRSDGVRHYYFRKLWCDQKTLYHDGHEAQIAFDVREQLEEELGPAREQLFSARLDETAVWEPPSDPSWLPSQQPDEDGEDDDPDPVQARVTVREAHRQGMTLQEIGVAFGVSRERIRQIETRAMRRLRDALRRELAAAGHDGSESPLATMLETISISVDPFLPKPGDPPLPDESAPEWDEDAPRFFHATGWTARHEEALARAKGEPQPQAKERAPENDPRVYTTAFSAGLLGWTAQHEAALLRACATAVEKSATAEAEEQRKLREGIEESYASERASWDFLPDD